MDNGGIIMYVDTLITLQENLTTYAVDGKKVSGHVTINSPGMIKCYVQNLKGLESGHEYMCYAFSKVHNKGVRIGTLSTQRESRWKVNEKDVAGSGLGLSDLDAVAIVAENGMRGIDTVLMGFKNNRYMIIPLIDDIAKLGQKPQPQLQEKKQVECKKSKLVNHKNIIQPDAVVEGENPISKMNAGKKDSGYLKLQENGQTTHTSGTVSSVVTTTSNIWAPVYNPNQATTQTVGQGNIMPLQNGNANNNNIIGQSQEQEPIDQGKMMSLQNGNANSNNIASQNQQQKPIDQGMMISLQNGNANNNNTVSQNQEHEPIDQGKIMSLQNGTANSNNQGNQNIMSYKASKTPILGEYEFDTIVATESLEDNTSTLTKNAENLPEVEKGPAVSMSVKSGEAYIASVNQEASVVRKEQNMDKMERMADQLAKELEDIIAKLKGEGIATEKLLEVEKQIEAIGNAARSYNMEQTLENRYIAQQSRERDENIEKHLANNEEKAAIADTSPKNAINYIQNCMSDKDIKQAFNGSTVMHNEYDISEEIDYLNEMERRIQDIEQRRKNEERN